MQLIRNVAQGKMERVQRKGSQRTPHCLLQGLSREVNLAVSSLAECRTARYGSGSGAPSSSNTLQIVSRSGKIRIIPTLQLELLHGSACFARRATGVLRQRVDPRGLLSDSSTRPLRS